MQLLHKTSIKSKQTLIVMLTSGVALLLACGAFASYEVMTFRAAMVENLSTLAEIIGNNSSAALDFSDPKTAKETLAALHAEPNIVAACVYTAKGGVFAVYDRPNDGNAFIPPACQSNNTHFSKGSLELFRPIVRDGEALGTVYVVSDLNALYSRLGKYALIAVGVFFASGLVAFLLSSQLGRLISGPILSLVQTTHAVTVEKNYSVRAVKQSDDELGVLIDAFNEMLKQIQERDAALQKSHVELENRVKERTEEVVNSLSLIRATLESTTDGILVTDGRGQVTSFNEKFLEMWNIPHEVADLKDEQKILEAASPQLKDSEQFLLRINELYADPERGSFDLLQFKDGRVFERYSMPQRVEEKCVGRVWSIRDITERKRSESELEQAHKQLMDTSRQAGMAEVATSVLHNVGNVLNSVNVSSTLVSNQVRKSKVANLPKVVALLNEHAADLGVFLTNDPKGKQLPGYLGQLAEHLVGEQTTVLKELQLLHENIEHIKDIVVMQQSYARISGVVETVKITDLIEDALRLNLGALQRHGVEVVREYEDMPSMDVEKHKILQILVNLVRNAKYACDESLRTDKQMTLRATKSDGQIQIAIIDNGIGIPAENLIRIFNHGFTTRKDGHGFGLHSAVLTAMELGGSLRVHSDGPDKGATFTLELPYKPHGKE
ncbi:MAG TPA: CHASE sensor domain-containing protein [Candidatus Methylacidiphilales bacterium]|jgi:PAS domain S-box-containing protein|nr:CHASE sensor domain-containing protein [Candidatus Methylacidiphilales bacterium]